ncbi:hypothetical protein K3495_g14119, partial [Podosphaera aphanis]
MEDGRGKYNALENLTQDNHEYWFRRMKLKLQSKDVYFTIENTVIEYALITRVEGSIKPKLKPTGQETNGDPEIDQLANSFEALGRTWNIEKKKEYTKAQASALNYMLECLIIEDHSLVDEHETARGVWNALKTKYSKTSESTANEYMSMITSFKFDPALGVYSNWDKLKEYRRKLISADQDMKNTFPDKSLYLILTKSLPPAYKATTDSNRVHLSMDLSDKLRLLYEVEQETRVQRTPKVEQSTGSFDDHANYSRAFKGPSRGSGSTRIDCHLCGQ